MVFRGKNLFEDITHNNWIGLKELVEDIDSSSEDKCIGLEELEEFLTYGQYVATGAATVDTDEQIETAMRAALREISGFVDIRSLKALMVHVSISTDVLMLHVAQMNAVINKLVPETCQLFWEVKQSQDKDNPVRVIMQATWDFKKFGDFAIIPCSRNFFGDLTHRNWVLLKDLVEDLRDEANKSDNDTPIMEMKDYEKFIAAGQHVATGVAEASSLEDVETMAGKVVQELSLFGCGGFAKCMLTYIATGVECSGEWFCKISNSIQKLAVEDCTFIWAITDNESYGGKTRIVVHIAW